MKPTPTGAGRNRPLFIAIPLLAALLALLLVARPGLAQDPVLPETTPDGFTGLDIFEQRCATCHGPNGAGDGEMAGRLPAPPRPFDADYLLRASPSTMFLQITNGNTDVAMPPFGPASSNPIDEPNRWDLVAAVFSLATPPEAVAAGETVYQAQCAACHGDTGAGDGPEAGDTAPTDLTAIDYWYNRTNQVVLDELAPGVVPAHTYELSEADLVNVVDYARTFSYGYADPAELTAPIEAGVISGVLTNGTTGEALSGADVNLRAFTNDFEQTLTLTTTTGIDGGFRFDVTDVPPDWVYIASSIYEDLSFSSGADQISRGRTELEMPITVYEQTTDPSAVSIGQLHVVMEFAEDAVQVNELYIFNNNEDAVFVGPEGVPDETGTVEIAVPAGVQGLEFQRSFGSMTSFLPANDFLQTDRGWADPLPLRPGPGALTLLVRYQLPYESGMTIAHPVYYDAAMSTIILPDAGVSVDGAPWVEQAPQQMGQGEMFLNYSRPGLIAGEALTIDLSGRPRLVSNASGAATVNRNQTNELIIGGAALLIAAVAGVFLWRGWQRRQAGDDDELYEEVVAPAAVEQADPDELLRAIAELDDAHEAGQIDEADYQAQRAELKRRLAAVWGR